MKLPTVQWHSLKTRVTLITLLIFMTSIWGLSFYASRVLRADMQQVLGEQEFATVSAFAHEINDDLTDRMQALQAIAWQLTPAVLSNTVTLQTMLEQRPLLQLLFNGGAWVARTDGVAIADVPRSANRVGTSYLDRDFIAAALRDGKASVGPPVLGRQTKSPVFAMAVPVRDASGVVIGVLVGVTDLGKPNFLDQVTQNRYGRTGGYLLFDPQHQVIVTASDKSRVMQAMPAPGQNAMHDKYVKGYEGFGLATSSRGVLELSAAKGIAVTGWFLVAVLPAKEAFAPIDAMLQRLLLSALVASLLAGMLTWWLVRRVLQQQLAPMLTASRTLTQLADSDQPAQALPVTSQDEIGALIGSFNQLLETLRQREADLSDSEQNLAITLNSIGDAVIATDAAGLITGMNPAAERLCGWLMAEALGRPLQAVFHILNADTREPAADPVQLVMTQGRVVGLAKHTLLVSRDGQEYQISDSAAPIRDATDEVVGVVLVFSDVTERYRAEAALIESEERWKFAIEGVGDGLWDWHVQSGETFYSHRYKAMLGYDDHEIGSTADEWVKRIHPDDLTGVMATMQPYLEGKSGSVTVEYRMLCKDGSWQWTLGRGLVVSRDAQGKPLRMIGTNTDITERRQIQAVDAFLAQTGSGPDDLPFFDALARFLGQSLQMDYVCVDRLMGDTLDATTLAIWHDGHFEDNLTYCLADTPCAEVAAQKEVCCYPSGVRQLFPHDASLADLMAESYIGTTLLSHSGQAIGLIAVIGRSPLARREQAVATLTRVAMRAAGELERLNAEANTLQSESRFRGVFEKAYAGMAVADGNGTLLEANDCLARMLGFERHELIGQNIAQFTHADDLATELIFLREMQSGQRDDYRMNKRYLTRSGAHIWVDLLVTVVRDKAGGVDSVIGLVLDISERLIAEERRQLAANVFSHAREGITITNAQGIIVDVNEAFTRITGYTREEALGQSPSMLSSGRQDTSFYAAMWRALIEQGHWSGEIWNRRKDGQVIAELLTISAVQDALGNTQNYVALFSDITALKEHESQLDRMAHFDALTSLPNRLLLADRLQQSLAQAGRRGQTLAVVYLDLDGFKAINDTHGHAVGDQLLIALATRMRLALREGDTIARISGDEFVAVLVDLGEVTDSVPLLKRLLAAAAQPVQVGDNNVQVSASLGVTFYPQTQDIEADQLLRQADQAMYQAKVAGKNRYHLFDAAHDSHLRGHHESLERIRLALSQDEFVLHYQPKVNMRTGQVVGVEALIRWQHPQKGLLAPASFLPVIEDDPLAVAVGEWVIDTALGQIERWRASGLDLPVSVNIGARQLQQVDFVEQLRTILAAHPRVSSDRLELEVLETSALADIAQVSCVIAACATLGIVFALDDFGTGYSSLTYLKRLRVALLKIDQSFVRDMLDDPDDLAILQGVIGLAAAFNRQVIAEGVETVAHGTLLLKLGCALAQGYGIARPMPADDIPLWARNWRADPAWTQTMPLA